MQTAYYDSTKASRFIRAGFSPAIVNLALAYNAANRGDDSQVGSVGAWLVADADPLLHPATCLPSVRHLASMRSRHRDNRFRCAHPAQQPSLLECSPSWFPCLMQIMTFCENLKTLTDDMSFGLSLAAGALMDAKNDLSAAANLCTELS